MAFVVVSLTTVIALEAGRRSQRALGQLDATEARGSGTGSPVAGSPRARVEALEAAAQRGDFRAAEVLLEKLLNEEQPPELQARLLTAGARIDLARYRIARAKTRGRRAVAIALEVGDPGLVAGAWAAVAEVARETNSDSAAILHALEQVRDHGVLAGDPALRAWSEAERGFVRWWNLRQVEDPVSTAFAPALAVAEDLDATHIVARVLDHIANAQLREDDLSAFFRTQERALKLWEELGNRARQAVAHLQFGWVWDRLESPRRAFRHYEKCLELAEASGFDLVAPRCHRHWAAAELRSGQSELAVARLRALISGNQPWSEEARSIFGVLGDAHRRLGELTEAEVAYDRALALDPVGDVSFRVWIDSGKARTALAAGDVERARQLLAELEELVGPRSDWSDRRRVMMLRVSVLERASDRAALATLLEAAEIETRSLGSVGSLTVDHGLGALGRLLPRVLPRSTALTPRRDMASRDPANRAETWAEEAFRLLEQARLRPWRRIRSGERPAAREVGGSRLEQELSALGEARRAVAAAAATPSPANFAQLREAYARYEEEVFRSRSGTRASVGRAATISEIRQRLPENTAILAYVLVRDLAVAFMVRNDRFETLPLAFRPQELRSRIKILRHTLATRQGSAWRAPARELGRLLLDPLEEGASLEAIERLLIVPMGDLYDLPFATLLDGEGKPWVERVAISLLPAASILLEPSHGSQGHGLVFGNDSFDGRGLPPLPAARREAEGVARLSSSRLIFGESASERRFRKLAPTASRLHLVTHAQAEPELPGLSRLFLASSGAARDSADDGELTVRELLDLDLRAELVTLSACQSGLALPAGQRPGAGLRPTGLMEGFLLAGARNVLGTVFPVEDEATASFMLELERELTHQPPIDALATVQRRSAKSTGPDRHPGHWAAFVLAGPGTLAGEGRDVEADLTPAVDEAATDRRPVSVETR